MPVSCGGIGHGGWNGVYRTTDLGGTWTLGHVPFNWFQLPQISFADASTGFAFARSTSTQSDLYKTTDSGRDWTSVKKNVFAGQAVDNVDFISATTGFATTPTSQGTSWVTTDGGLTWSLPGHKFMAGNIGCPGPTDPAANSSPIPVLMASPSVGWMAGAKRTTDGGAHWLTVGPPSVPDRSSGYAEFFLDATHAWVAQAAGTSTTCADHIVVFRTADGGLTWQQGSSIPVTLSSPIDRIWGAGSTSASRARFKQGDGPFLFFVDAMHGWLQVTTVPQDFMGIPKVGPLYSTADGGLHWAVVSASPAAKPDECGAADYAASTVFSSPTTGWRGIGGCDATTPASLLVTHDEGEHWTLEAVGPECGCGGAAPIFFDEMHGWLDLGTFLLVTSDGGKTWSRRAEPSGPNDCNVNSAFSSASDAWLALTDCGGTPNRTRLVHSANAGRTWVVVSRNLLPADSADAWNPEIYFFDSRIGFMALMPKLYKTTDGGRTWSLITTAGP